MGRIVKVVIARHGKTGKAAVDAARMLVETGKEDCIAASNLLSEITFQTAISSTAVRAIETTWLLLGNTPPREIITLKELYEHPDEDGRARCDKLFVELGYAPLSKYLEKEDGKILLEIGKNGKNAVQNAIGPFYENTLIVSHAVIVNALGLSLFPDSPQVERIMLNHSFLEAGMVEIEVEVYSQEVVGAKVIN